MSPHHASVATDIADPESLLTAVGLIWGLIEQEQIDQALVMVTGCLLCWNRHPILLLLESQCRACLNEVVNTDVFSFGDFQIPQSWNELVRRIVARQNLNTSAL